MVDPAIDGKAGVRGWIARHRSAALGIAVLVAVALGAAFYWFQPHKAFLDARADDAAVDRGRVLASGAFRSLEHETKGTAKVIESLDGSRTLRLEDLATSNGPELVVMLSSTPSSENGWSAYDDGAFVILEPLKGNLGSQNYAIPGHVDLGRYRSAVIWCNRFSVAFGAAPVE